MAVLLRAPLWSVHNQPQVVLAVVDLVHTARLAQEPQEYLVKEMPAVMVMYQVVVVVAVAVPELRVQPQTSRLEWVPQVVRVLVHPLPDRL